jgi:hypothetical protein
VAKHSPDAADRRHPDVAKPITRERRFDAEAVVRRPRFRGNADGYLSPDYSSRRSRARDNAIVAVADRLVDVG